MGLVGFGVSVTCFIVVAMNISERRRHGIPIREGYVLLVVCGMMAAFWLAMYLRP